MKKLSVTIFVLLVASVTFAVAESDELVAVNSRLLDLLKDLVDSNEDMANGVPLMGEYEVLVAPTLANVTATKTVLSVMPEAECDYIAYALDKDGMWLDRDDAMIGVAAWNGYEYREGSNEWVGSLEFDDEFFVLELTFTQNRLNASEAMTGYFEYSCN
tara:strand:- start:3501 stop:3977 length:477 start_codon:yes stop_codon:yes gene_type:complete